jgi:uncharacterized membrane protein YagU involved in acid resistance
MLDWKAAILAGIIAGVIFMMLEMALVMAVQGQSPWGPPRMMAAMVMGKDVLPPPASFDMTIIMVAMVVHLMLSVVLGIVFGLIATRFPFGMGAAIIAGAVFGVAVYVVDFYGFTTLFPWFAMARSAISLFSHAIFGAVLGGAYRAIAGSEPQIAPTPGASGV